MEKRVLVAFVLSAAIFVVWTTLFPPPEAPVSRPGPSAPVATELPVAVPLEQPPVAPSDGSATVAGAVEAIAAVADETVTLRNEVVSITLSNRGAAVTELKLSGYKGDDAAVLELVQSIDQPWRALPLQLVTADGPDQRLYVVEQVGRQVAFRWSDGQGTAVEKVVSLGESGYGLDVKVSATGSLAAAELCVATGLRDIGAAERENRFSTWGDAALLADGELEAFKRDKVKGAQVLRPTQTVFAGFSDTYFLHVFQARRPLTQVVVEPFQLVTTAAEGGEEATTVLQVRVVGSGGQWVGRLFSAPKEYDLLQREGGGLEQTLHFGFFHPISVFFLLALRWIYAQIGNYGWAIVLLTLGIRIVLFPLMHTSTVSMRRMQKVQPKVKAIQEKYKKGKSDPLVRNKMNQEMMDLYKAEGVNPMGGCLPVLVQLPLLWALYNLFSHAIELRHAPFVAWIVDLSAKDPIYITPILMTGTMWLQQRLAPQVGDPQQQKIFRLMPLVFGVMFLGFPSGLVLYWLANNVITILQQELTLHLIGERGAKGGGGKGKKA